jgi:hypothetical protein
MQNTAQKAAGIRGRPRYINATAVSLVRERTPVDSKTLTYLKL